MSWGKVCDTLHAHRKAAKAGLEAMGLWVMAMSWSRDKCTDGFIPADRPLRLADDDQDAAERCVAALVRAKLWEPVDGGWQFHDWEDVQDSAAERAVKQADLSAKRAEAGRLGGLAKAGNSSKPKHEPEALANCSNSSPSPLPTPTTTTNTSPPPGLPDPPAMDLVRVAQDMADEGNEFGKSCVQRLASGRPLSPNQRAALIVARDKRLAALAPPPPGPPPYSAPDPPRPKASQQHSAAVAKQHLERLRLGSVGNGGGPS